jgi:protein-disulfide isomerase
MVLSTVGALTAGLAIVLFAVTQRPQVGAPGADLIAPAVPVAAALADGRQIGRADAPVLVEIWSDFQCPACRKLAVEIEPSIISTLVATGTARLEYHDAAFQGQHGANRAYDESVEAAAGARCAADQGKFWQMHDWLFANWDGENEGAFAAARLRSIAAAADLDLVAFDSCMSGGDKQDATRAETQQGVAAGVSSTPTLAINGYVVNGVPTVAQLSTLINQAAEAVR